MSVQGDTNRVKRNILTAFELRKIKLYALCLSYAGRAINIFRQEQGEQTFWTNQTNQAFQKMFSSAFMDAESIGFFLSHSVLYGIYLELANDRQNESIKPIIESLVKQFREDVAKL